MKFDDVCKLLNACTVLKETEHWYGYVDKNAVFFNSKRDFNEAVNLLKKKSCIFIQRGKLTRYAITSDIRMEISVNGIPLVCYLPKLHYFNTKPPAECYRIHLATPDPKGEPV